MNSKHFLVNPYKGETSKEVVAAIEKTKSDVLKNGYDKNRTITKQRLFNEESNLKHVEGRVIIKIDIDSKDIHRFDSGIEIYRGRRFNELNRRITEPVNAIVVDAEYIPKGVEILIHPNSICDANKIFDYAPIGAEENNAVRYYSIEEGSAFIYREGEEWKPLKGFATGLRIFKPYKGFIVGIAPTQIKDCLFIQSGEYKNKAVQTLRSCDYEIIFTGTNGQEQRIIRCRHYENEAHDREEIIIERHDLTELIEAGDLFIGLSIDDAKSLKDYL